MSKQSRPLRHSQVYGVGGMAGNVYSITHADYGGSAKLENIKKVQHTCQDLIYFFWKVNNPLDRATCGGERPPLPPKRKQNKLKAF